MENMPRVKYDYVPLEMRKLLIERVTQDKLSVYSASKALGTKN